MTKSDDEITLDFGKFFKRKPKKSKEHNTEEHDSYTDSSISNPSTSKDNELNLSSIFKFFYKYRIFFLIIIPMILCIFFRAMPYTIPAADGWAEDTVIGNIKGMISTQVSQAYPGLPDSEIKKKVNEQYDKVIEERKAELDDQIKGQAEFFRSKLKDEDGQTYLLAIDPYLWYGNSKNYIENGQFGDTTQDGKDWYSLRNGRIGRASGVPFNSMVTVVVYKLVHMVNRDYTPMAAAFAVPMLVMALGVIPVFFIGRKFGGDIGGFFAACIFAIHPSLIGRTVAGFSDTDPYTIFFPVLTIWLFFEALDAKKNMTKTIYSILAGFAFALFNLAWQQGWWYTFDFILATMGLYLAYYFVTNYKSVSFSKLHKNKQVVEFFSIVGVISLSFIVIRTIFSLFYKSETISMGIVQFYSAIFVQPLWFIKLKQVAITTIWPNVLTTVAELNPSNLKNISNSMGGFIMVSVALLGLILVLYNSKDEDKQYVKFAILLIIWSLASVYAAVKSLRFIALIVPVFSLAFGAGLGLAYTNFKRWISEGMNMNKKVAAGIILVVYLLLFIMPVKSAYNTSMSEIPSFTDAWYDSLTEIRDNSDDGIITSWWDFGHWFVAMGERRVTFDGGDQGNRIHWVGKTLLTDNEDEAVSILKMLNCGQELGFDTLETHLGDSLKAKLLMDQIIRMDRVDAETALKDVGLDKDQREEVLGYTHCEDLIDQYYITSEDMVGKAGVWGHFGSWNFTKAYMFNTVKKQSQTKGIDTLVNDFGLTKKEADKTYYEIKQQSADQWVTGWPNYASGESQCNDEDSYLICRTQVCLQQDGNNCLLSIQATFINKTSKETIFVLSDKRSAMPHSLVYPSDGDLAVEIFNESQIGLSVDLVKRNGQYLAILMDPSLSKSTFTRLFYYDGLGSKYFRPLGERNTFTGQKIQTWTVSFEDLGKYSPDTMGMFEPTEKSFAEDNVNPVAKEVSSEDVSPSETDIEVPVETEVDNP